MAMYLTDMAKYLPETKEYELIIPWNEAITIKLYSKEQIYKQELKYLLPHHLVQFCLTLKLSELHEAPCFLSLHPPSPTFLSPHKNKTHSLFLSRGIC